MRRTDLAADRGDVDDPAAVPLTHLRQHGQRWIENAPEHDVHGLLEVGDRHGGERTHLNDTSVVEEDVDAPVVTRDLRHSALDILPFCDIALHGVDIAAL